MVSGMELNRIKNLLFKLKLQGKPLLKPGELECKLLHPHEDGREMFEISIDEDLVMPPLAEITQDIRQSIERWVAVLQHMLGEHFVIWEGFIMSIHLVISCTAEGSKRLLTAWKAGKLKVEGRPTTKVDVLSVQGISFMGTQPAINAAIDALKDGIPLGKESDGKIRLLCGHRGVLPGRLDEAPPATVHTTASDFIAGLSAADMLPESATPLNAFSFWRDDHGHVPTLTIGSPSPASNFQNVDKRRSPRTSTKLTTAASEQNQTLPADGYDGAETGEALIVKANDTPAMLSTQHGFDLNEFLRINKKRFPGLKAKDKLEAGTSPLWLPRAATSDVVTVNGELKESDSDDDDDPWSHLEGFWVPEPEEEEFWRLLEENCEKKPGGTFEKLQKMIIGGSKVDAYGLREFIRIEGRSEDRPNWDVNDQSMRWFDHYFNRGMSDGKGKGMLWSELWIKGMSGKKPMNQTSRLRTIYKNYIAPLERSKLLYRPVRISVNGDGYMKMEPEATGDATTLDEECADELTKTDGRVQLRSDLLEALEAITMRLPDVSDSRNGVDIELLSKNVARLTAKLKHANEGYGEPVSVAIVGSNRRGKSHFLNSTLAITEVSSQLYNCSPFENSDDAAHVAARMCFDSGPLTLSADGPTMSADDPTSPTRDEGSLFEHLRERIHAVDMSTADDRERKPCPSGQVQRQPHGPQLGAGEMPCPEDDFCTVVWMLPKQGPHEWTDFDVDGRLRHTRSPFDDHYITVGKVDAMYADYISGKDHPDPNVRPSPSEFLLPSNGSGKSVTSHNTYVWGGERYTLILKYTSAEKIDNLIGNLIATADGDDSYKSALKKTLVEILHILKDGVSPADASEEDRVRFDNKRDNYINRWAKIKSMKELQDDEWGPMQWWKMTGRVRHYSNAGAVVHSGIHQSVRDTFGKIYIYQGAGKHALDDRMYIKATLAKLLDPADAASRLVEEVHVTAPSTELTRHTALVDTPGTNDVDPVKFVQLREAAARATGFLVFAATALSAATDTMNALCDHGIIDRAIKRYVTGAMDQPGSTSSSDEILFVECSARHSGMNLMPRAIQGTENPKSLLSKTAKDARKITVSDQEESIKNLVLNRAHDTVRAGGSIGDASFSLPTGMSGEDKEIAEDELRDRIRHNIAIPLSKDRSHNMNVAVYRGIVKSPLHEKWMRDCRAETGGDAVMTALRKMLRGIVSAVEVRKLADQCSTVHEIVIAPATEPVPDYVRKKAQSLHDNRMTSPAQLKTSIWDTITSEMKNLWAPDGTPVGSVDWVAGVTDELLMALTGVTEVFRDLSAGRSGALENAAQSDVRADFDRCAKGQLFQKAGKMSRIAFGLCRTAFKADELWEAAFASPIKAALEKLLKDVFEPHCCNSLLGGDDASPVSSQATASVVSAIRTAFNVRKRLNNVQAEFFKDTKHFAQTFGPLARTLPRDSLPQRVLERLFKKLFENYIHADSQKVNRDPFGNGTRDNAEAKQELMDIFAKEHLQSNVTRQHLREVVRDELSKLTDKVGVSLRSLFLTLRRRRGVMNPSMDARRTNIIIKETMGHVASCKGVAADDGLMKVKDFKAACGKILRIAHDYEELDRHDDDVNQFGNRKQQAVGALDKLLEEKPQLKDMTLKDEFKAEMRMSSLRWPDADQNWCVDWPDLPKDESSFHEIGTGDRLPDSTRESKIIDVLPDGIKDRAIRQGYTLIHSPMLDEGKGICSARCVLFSTLADAIEIRKEENPAAFRKDFCRAMELHMNTIGITVSDFRACLTETLNMKHVGAHLELYFLGSKKGFKRAPRFDRRRVVRLVWDEELKCLSVLVIHKRQHRVQTPDPGTGETHHELDPTKHASYMKEKSAAKTYYSGLVKYNRDNGGPGSFAITGGGITIWFGFLCVTGLLKPRQPIGAARTSTATVSRDIHVYCSIPPGLKRF